MDGKKRSVMRGTLAVLGTTAAVVLALFGVSANAATADGTSAMGYETATESGVKVFVDAPEGALPEDAKLHAEPVESEKDNQAVADELEKADVSYDGFLALDVYFTDADGNEVEPAEPVDVRFELPEGAVPEGAEDLAVHHLAEAEDGTVADVEAVADDADATEGAVAIQDDAAVDAEFTVESFSTFTVTWNESKDEEASVSAKAPGKPGDKLTTVDTVDSTAEGVHMYMFNYEGPAFTGADYDDGTEHTGQTTLDIATSTVDNNGWPSLTGVDGTPKGRSFKDFFGLGNTENAYSVDSSYAKNHLFLQENYNYDGTFHYSGFENFATLVDDYDGNFTVYEQLGTASNEKQYFYQRGNFMPYNDLNINTVWNQNLYGDEGQALNQGDPRYGENLYALKGTKDYYFGMYVWADFYQPKDGLVVANNGDENPMIFEFTGDDDMWVYIDGVLVLDLGGIHDAQSGYINFQTGEVMYTTTIKNQPVQRNYTSIKKMYEEASRTGSTKWDGNTFADGTSHRIQIFYMERGKGASNLKIDFNLKTIPDGQLAVSKDVEHYYDPQIGDVTYKMKVEVFDEDANCWVPYANQNYTFFEQEGGGTTDSNGCFDLLYNQTALFDGIDVGTKVRVSEIGTSDTPIGVEISENYTIAYEVVDGSGQPIEDSSTTGGYAEAEMPGYGSVDVTVTNTAKFTRPLKVIKNFDGTEGNTAPEGFEATYTLYEVDESGNRVEPAIGSVKYSDFENGEYVFWLDTDKNYTVVESFEDGDNKGDTDSSKWSSVTATTNDAADGTEASDGIVYLDEHDATEGNDVDTITLTNHYGLTIKDVLKVTKTENGSWLEKDMFEFTIEPQASGKGDTAVSAQQAAEKAGLKLVGDVYAYSNVGSARPGETGLARMGNEITFTTDDIGKTYVYEYAETGELTDSFKQDSGFNESDFIFDEAKYRVELAVSEKDGKLQVTMTKLKWNADEKKWEQSGEPVDITSENCDCSESYPLMTVDFKNAYIQSMNVTFPVGIEKTLEGGQLKDDMFKFSVTAQKTDTVEAADAAIKAGSTTQEGEAVNPWAVTNTGNKFSIFGSMHFSAGDVGNVYEYVISEDASYNAGGKVDPNDYLYDDTQYLVQFKPVIATSVDGAKSLEVELWVAERSGSEESFPAPEKVGAFSRGEFAHVNSQAQGRALQDDPQYNLEFTNTVSKASLSISKVLENNGLAGYAPKDVEFTIQIVLKDKDDKPIAGPFSATGVEGQQSVMFNESGIATVTLKAGETITITGLPVGAKYTVTEPEESIPGGFKLVEVSGSGSDKPTTREALVDHIDGDIDPMNNNVTVKNMFVGYGLGIFKGELAYNENGDIALGDDDLPYADPKRPLSGAVFEISAENEQGEKQAIGRLETDEDGKAVFMSLPDNEGKTYQTFLIPGTYYINEVKVPSGYQLLGYGITLTISNDGKATISIPQGENESPIVKQLGFDEAGNLLIEVANKPNPDLPSSGSNGTLVMMSTGFAAIVLAGTYLSKRFGHLWN